MKQTGDLRLLRSFVKPSVVLGLILIGVFFSLACTRSDGGEDAEVVSGGAEILADTTFLADIVGNVAGDRLRAASLIPEGVDPHSFEPTPRDAERLAECRALVINVTGLVPSVDDLIAGTGDGERVLIVAAAGLSGLDDDPHCWLDPNLVMTYVQNIADGLAAIDAEGAEAYRANAATYTEELKGLDSWIVSEVDTIPTARRLLVTDHESLSRFAARYGFEVVGAVYPTTTGEVSPSARSLAQLIEAIRGSGAPAVFVEAGGSSDIAEQIAEATGAIVVTDLYTHSLGPEGSTYIDMMRWNVTKIVEALR